MLKLVLRLNALSCIGFGVVLLVNAPAVSSFIGSAPEWLLRGLGLALIGNGAHLVWASLRPMLGVTEIRYFAIGDFAWAATTVALIFASLFITTSMGIIAALAVAALVGVFGVLQWRFAGGKATASGVECSEIP